VIARFVLLLIFLCLPFGWVQAAEFDHSHQPYAHVLKKSVKDSLVNYGALKSDHKDLNTYLDQLAGVPEKDFKKWSRSQQLSFLINLYNAQTLQLIINHYPLKSIKDIGNFLKGPWDQPVVRLFGKEITLNKLEHELLRKEYQEPRLHFVLVCAALGCPPLQEEPYLPDKLEQQFEDQGKRFLANRHKNSVNVHEHVIYLSPIFRWFEDDFVNKSGSVLAFVQPYFPLETTRALLKGGFKIRYTDYNWSLNDSSSQKH